MKSSRAIDKSKSRYGLKNNYSDVLYTPLSQPSNIGDEYFVQSIVEEHEKEKEESVKTEKTLTETTKGQPTEENKNEDELIEIKKELFEEREERKTLEKKISEINEIVLEANARILHLQKQNLKLTTERQNNFEKLKKYEEKVKGFRSKESIASEVEKKIKILEEKMNRKQKVEEENVNLRERIVEIEAKYSALKASMSQLVEHVSL